MIYVNINIMFTTSKSLDVMFLQLINLDLRVREW